VLDQVLIVISIILVSSLRRVKGIACASSNVLPGAIGGEINKKPRKAAPQDW
jgi:hypothetical protein